MIKFGDKILWSPIFRRTFVELEESQFFFLQWIFLISLCDGRPRAGFGSLQRMVYSQWLLSSPTISTGTSSPSPLRSFWEIKVPPRVISFRWLALHESVLTMDNMRQRKLVIGNLKGGNG